MKQIWERFVSWAEQNSEHYRYVPIPVERVEGQQEAPPPLQVYGSYFSIHLAQMFLSNSRKWFRDWYPACHTSVRLQYSDYPVVNLSHVTHVPEGALSRGVLLNYPLTSLIPYRGGTVEIQAGLLALKGQDYLQTTIKLLQNFSSLVAAPLAQALTVAEKISSGMQDLLGATDGEIQLSFHQTFTDNGGNTLQPGYYAAILATANQLDEQKLSVKEDQLLYNGRPLTGYDYLLFRIDSVRERQDWRLQSIQENLTQATTAYLRGKDEDGQEYETAAIVAAFQSLDLSEFDRRRVAQAIRDELAALKGQGLGAVGDHEADLNQIVSARAMSWEKSAALGVPTLQELMA